MMQFILMAAGQGTRLGSKTLELPKTLLKLEGKPLCHHILDSLLQFNPESIIVVGGFKFQKLADSLAPYSGRISLVENRNYTKGNLLTLLCAQEQVSSSFAVFNADHHYSEDILGKVFGCLETTGSVTVVCDFDRPVTDDDMKVKLSDDLTLHAMSKKLAPHDAGYIGITLVPKERSDRYWESARETLISEGELSCAEAVLNRMVLEGEKVALLDVSGSWWFEVDTPEDLERAKIMMGGAQRD